MDVTAMLPHRRGAALPEAEQEPSRGGWAPAPVCLLCGRIPGEQRPTDDHRHSWETGR